MAGTLPEQHTLREESSSLPPNYRWNFTVIVMDITCFGASLALASVTSVMPAFVRRLTDSAVLVGLIGTVFTGFQLLPQLPMGQLVKDKPRKKPYVLAAMVGRISFWLIAGALWAGLASHPGAMLILFFVCLALFAGIDGLGLVPWLDIVARAIPLRKRGRMMGTAHFFTGLVGIAAGAVVGLVLGRLAFPTNYALLFTLAVICQILSFVAIVLLREPPQDSVPRIEKHDKGSWFHPLTDDPVFRRLMLCRILFGSLGLAIPFYVMHAGDVLHLPENAVGGFVVAQTLAGVVSGAGLGLISDRWGPRRVIHIGSAVAATGPLFALTAHLSRAGWLVHGYSLVFVALGVANSTLSLGLSNYLLEIAPDGIRPTYLGLGHTIGGLTALAPTIGGWLLQATSYTTLFGLTALGVMASLVLSFGLTPARAPGRGQGQS